MNNTEQTQQIIYGSEIKLNINIKPIDSVHMSDYDFNIVFFTNNESPVTLTKEQCKQVDVDNYLAMLDTKQLGLGKLKMKITAYIPDEDFDDYSRTEVIQQTTGIQIVKSWDV